MSRREMLRKVGLAITVGVAGCNVLQNESEAVDTEYELTTEDHLGRAISDLNTVALAIREFQSSENPGEATFDEEQPQERLTTAREAITTAEESAKSDSEEADIQAARAYADTMEGTVTAVKSLETASTGLEESRGLLQANEVDTEAASSTLGQTKEASSTAVEAHEMATSALEAADGDRLQRLNAQYEAMDSGLKQLAGFVTGVDGLTDGYDNQVTGIDNLQTAEDRVTAEEYDAADEAFVAARSAFDDSATAFQDAVEEAAESLVSDLERGDKQSRSLIELAGGYVNLLSGQDAVSAAQTELEEEAFDAARESLTTGSDEATQALDQFESGAAILKDEFTDLFETARNRATAMESLADGYALVLDSREQVSTAESEIDANEYDAARDSLDTAATDSTAADEEFASGQEGADDLFASEFETARTRAQAIRTLSTGYSTLLDARDHLEAGESSFLDEAYGDARTSFNSAAETSQTAAKTFSEGRSEDGADIFSDAFSRADQRAAAVEALSNGYATMVSGQEDAQAGRDDLDDQNFDSAADHFETAGTTLENADTTLSEGREAANGEFQSEFDRALCQVGHLISAVEHFKAAAEAGSNRNRRDAKEEQNNGDEDLDRVEDC